MAKKLVPLNLQSMVDKLEFADIAFLAVEARLREQDDANFAADVKSDEQNDEKHLHAKWGLRVRHQDNELGVRFVLNLELVDAKFTVDVAVTYLSSAPVVLRREAIEDFVNDVALMQAYPYIRECIDSLATRVLREPVLLPVLKRGDMRLKLGKGPDISDPDSTDD